MEQDVEKLQELVDQYDRIVFFGGAGVLYREWDSGFSKCGWTL